MLYEFGVYYFCSTIIFGKSELNVFGLHKLAEWMIPMLASQIFTRLVLLDREF